MKTLKITCYFYQNTKTISQQESLSFTNFFKTKGIEVVGSLAGCHVGVKPIIYREINAHMKELGQIVIEKVEKQYVYIEHCRQYKYFYGTGKTNLLPDYLGKCHNLVEYKGQELEILSNHVRLLKKEAREAFEEADVHTGDVVIEQFGSNKYECIDYGILDYYEHDSKQHVLVPIESFDENQIWESIVNRPDISLCDIEITQQTVSV